MKKLLFISFAAALVASCAKDDLTANGGQFSGETESRYLAVNIVDNSDSTRADANNTTDYEDGTDVENAVTNIRFYLFDGNGDSFSTTPYVDTTAEAEENVEAEEANKKVEKQLQAVIVFSVKKTGDDNPETPAKIVAVLNPPAGLATDFADIDALQASVADYSAHTENTFIMSNSVYAVAPAAGSQETDPTEHVAYDITENNIKTSRAAALASPVKIYVERVVAKARVGIDTETLTQPGEEFTGDDKTNVYKITGGTQTIYGTDMSQGEEKEIYVKLLGWNVTATASKSRLVKKINPEWGWNNNSWLDGVFDWGANNAWNYPPFFRSFWAINPDGFAQTDLQFGNFNGSSTTSNTNPAAKVTAFDGATSVYMQENASWDTDGNNPTYPTKLIVAAQLVDATGAEVELGWYEGSYYLQDDLKQVILNAAKIFKKTTTTSGDTGQTTTTEKYEPAKTSDIALKFITTTAAGDFDAAGNRNTGTSTDVNRYNAYAQFNGTTLTGDYYVKNNDGTYTALADLYSEEEIDALAALNKELKKAGAVKVWASGNTYYWLDIDHLGGAGKYGEHGVVRNHIYDYTLGTIKGFGIPVLDPSETIYPETPNDPEMMYIAARINILSWRLVQNHNAQLGW